jgi:S1-C subfamily serine protease
MIYLFSKVTNYHVIRNAKVAQVAILTPTNIKNNDNSMGMLPPTKQASYDQPIDVFASPTSITRSNSAEVFSSDYRRLVYKATVVGVDPGKDIAILKLNAPPEVLYPISVGTSTGLRVGQQALAIGNPFGLDHTLTVGVISGLGREVKSPIGRPITNVIQSDAAINPGLY